jgi:RIO-like serine/threonine protein kinase
LGFVVERVAGKEIIQLAAERSLTPELANQIYKQITDQIKILRAKGLRHGDLNTRNVLVDTSSGQPAVRFIDYSQSDFLSMQRTQVKPKPGSPPPKSNDTLEAESLLDYMLKIANQK